MANYTYIKIIKKAPNVWVFNDSSLPTDAYIFANVYSDLVEQDLISFKTKTGGNVYNQQPYSIFEYIDELDGGNDFIPTSALQLHTYLLNDGFFGDSSGGGGGATTFLELLDVLIPTYAGNALRGIRINSAQTGLEAFDLGSFVQNNKPRIFRFDFIGIGELTDAEVVDKLNNIPTLLGTGFTISEIQTPVIITATKDGLTYQYMFMLGAGTYGSNPDNQVDENDIRLLFVSPTTIADITNDPDAEIIPLEGVVDGDFLAVANLTEWDFSDSGQPTDNGGVKTYYFSYTDDGVEYFVRFIGDAGEYGGANPPFTSDMFTATTNSDVTPVPTLQSVTDAGNTTTNHLIVDEGNLEERASLTSLGITIENHGYSSQITSEELTDDRNIVFPDKSGTVAMISDITNESLSFGLIVTEANTIQDDRLIGLNTTLTPFPFEIRAGQNSWQEFDDTDIFPDIAFDNVTGTITGFNIEVGKKVFLTTIR